MQMNHQHRIINTLLYSKKSNKIKKASKEMKGLELIEDTNSEISSVISVESVVRNINVDSMGTRKSHTGTS